MHTFVAEYRARLEPFLGFPVSPITDELFDRLARSLFAFQFKHVQPYRALCEARNVSPPGLLDWRDIPAVPTASFREIDWTSLAAGERTHVFHSSGTTGEQHSRHFHDADSLGFYQRSLVAWFRSHFLREVNRPITLLFLSPDPAAAPHSSLVHMFETLRLEVGATHSRFLGESGSDGHWTLSLERVDQALSESRIRRQPVALLGTAFSMVELIDHLTAANLCYALPLGSRLLETGGYKSRSRSVPKAVLYHRLSRALGIAESFMVSEYGMCELSSQAYDQIVAESEPFDRRRFRFPPWARAIVVDPGSGRPVGEGETGLLRVFDLANVRSVLAIQTEDIVRRRADGFELVGRASAAQARGCSLLSQ